jgi:hypothetical protein
VYVVKRKNGAWHWGSMDEKEKTQPIDLASGSVTLRIEGGGLKAGDKPHAGAEMFRITGTADRANSPFILEDGVSCLSPQWAPIIERLYKDCFGEDYLGKNPLRKPGAPVAKNGPASPKKAA